MTVPIVYLPAALTDIDSTYAEYEQRLVGLGERFLEALKDKLNRIQDNPELYGVIYQDVRAVPLRRFPHVVYYRIVTDNVLVIAVQHAGRSTWAWQDRV